MRRVSRKDRWGKLTNNQVTRWVGSRQLSWQHMAHRKLRQNPCAHTRQKHKHMCKTGHEHAANENTYKPRVHRIHDNMKTHSQWKTQAACHTAQDITWMHAADKNVNCMHTTWHVDRRAHGRANSRLHAHTTRQNNIFSFIFMTRCWPVCVCVCVSK